MQLSTASPCMDWFTLSHSAASAITGLTPRHVMQPVASGGHVFICLNKHRSFLTLGLFKFQITCTKGRCWSCSALNKDFFIHTNINKNKTPLRPTWSHLLNEEMMMNSWLKYSKETFTEYLYSVY